MPRPTRRTLLRTGLTALAVPGLHACTDDNPEDPGPSDSPTATAPATSPENPFGLEGGSQVQVTVFKGGYGTLHAEAAARLVENRHDGVSVTVRAVDDVAREVGTSLTASPPDVLDNSGAGRLQTAAILDQLEDLVDVVDAPNLDGTPIRDTLYAGALDPGTYGQRLVALNYAMTVYGLWYSASLFETNGWRPPQTWDDLRELGQQAREQGKYLFVWGSEAADYYLELCITAAIKEGGHDVRRALDSLAAGCWELPTVQSAFTHLAGLVSDGLVRPGGSSTPFLTAQAAWAKDQQALLYPGGSWLENEMRDQTAPDFRMTAAPVPTLTSSPSLPYQALHASAGESFVVPSAATNVAGGKEFLRVMLSPEVARSFTQEVLVPSVVKGTVPGDAYGSTSLASQVRMLGDAAEDVFTWRFDSYYGLGADHTAVFNEFLEGRMDVPTLTSSLQEATDAVRDDRSIPKYEVK